MNSLPGGNESVQVEGYGEAWQERLYTQLRDADVTIFSYVPDAGHRILIDRSIADNARHVRSPDDGRRRHWPGRRSPSWRWCRAVLLMQSSGAGNCINQLSLIQHGRFPFLTFISMRGDFGEGNPWQFAMGRAVEPTLSQPWACNA